MVSIKKKQKKTKKQPKEQAKEQPEETQEEKLKKEVMEEMFEEVNGEKVLKPEIEAELEEQRIKEKVMDRLMLKKTSEEEINFIVEKTLLQRGASPENRIILYSALYIIPREAREQIIKDTLFLILDGLTMAQTLRPCNYSVVALNWTDRAYSIPEKVQTIHHECAHAYLEHHNNKKTMQENEKEADDLTEKWNGKRSYSDYKAIKDSWYPGQGEELFVLTISEELKFKLDGMKKSQILNVLDAVVF